MFLLYNMVCKIIAIYGHFYSSVLFNYYACKIIAHKERGLRWRGKHSLREDKCAGIPVFPVLE
jgi:hypothetical protein